MRMLLGSCCALALLTIGEVRAASPARLIVDKAIMRSGGEANLKKHLAQTWTEKGTYYGMDDKGQPFTGKLAIQFPGQLRMAISSGGMEVFTIVLDKDKGWIKNFEGKVTEMGKDALKNQQSDNQAAWIATLLPLKDKEFKLTVIKGGDVDGKATNGLQVARTDFPTVKLYFNKESGLLAMSEYQTFSGEQKKIVMAQVYYSNYKMNEGAQIPMHVVVKHDGKLFVEADIIDLKAESKLDASAFAAPK